MLLDFLNSVFDEFRNEEAIIWCDQPSTYGWLSDKIRYWSAALRDENFQPGTVVALEGDFSPNSVALFLALVEARAIIVPLTESVAEKRNSFLRISDAQLRIQLDDRDSVQFQQLTGGGVHQLYNTLRDGNAPGLVLFSSGSTGESKAAIHDLVALLSKFTVPKRRFRSIAFLLYDHIGGINSMLYSLSNGGCLVVASERSPDGVLSTIERHRVELLPTSPTFINLVLLSEAYKRYDISSLTTVTYGTEPMPESTLLRFHKLFPHINLQQTYGLSEVGILRSRSKSSDSLWVQIGGEGFETRVVDAVLQIKAHSAMLGYLNAPSPFTADGWFNTGDLVEVDGKYFRFIGRQSEVINVGGEKVYPAEVENIIQSIDGVAEVIVYGEPNPIVGNIVCATVRVGMETDRWAFVNRVKRFCRERLDNYKVPVKVVIDDREQHGGRFKKNRMAAKAG
jgi:acyl-coenzyme A synthetase/AMP-(fatty) acid ligase